MTEPLQNPVPEEPEEFAPTREHEFQDSHYHDEEPDIVNDEVVTHVRPPLARKKPAPSAADPPLLRGLTCVPIRSNEH